MIRSMTGFGRCEHQDSQWYIRVEAKTVNHRYLDVFLRLGHGYGLLEEPIRKLVQRFLSRGRVELQIFIERRADAARNVRWDENLLEGYLAAFREIDRRLHRESTPTIGDLLQIPDLFSPEEAETDFDMLQTLVLDVVERALADLQGMRLNEGRELAEDLRRKAHTISQMTESMADRSPYVVQHHQQRLLERIQDLTELPDIPFDRISMETALFADRCSIDEEIVRLRSHVQQLHEIVESDEPIGRKLDFLIQEMNREANTIGSKANDAALSRLVVELKSQVEKMREQVQNIE